MKNQRVEISKNQPRTLRLNLSEDDVKNLCEKAGSVGLTVAELIENFIGDLVYGTHSNGSDERMYANEWFDRCWFAMFPENTFLKYLIDWGGIYEVIELWDDIKQAKKELADYEKNPEDFQVDDLSAIKEDIDYWQEELNEYFNSYQNEPGEKADSILEAGMKKVLKWNEENRSLLSFCR